ncbi:MAG: SDR family oxidoreductase [Flavobacteriaceae bacterium TMED42]|nr:SDR family oxidoreductase [Flavobacteriaceae bacterium]RPG65634.1 MAG: SDR family oxidoreductase [Flavobacteriaceae bacterium TMED42]RPG68546.1 MAG: SDR family oxidoreductase [Flavobacteriaceae bacterium TMED42]|tara:strand:+ start:555 stop:1301 length:747 start_codon:yes stop_codon:yes gene_type:complete
MKFDLSGKNAVVTGGSSGIGKAITETLKEQGAEVFVIDLNENPSHKKEGIHTITADITQWNELSTSLGSLPQTIDILVNNAGIGFVGNIEQTEEEDFDRLYQVNVKGVFNCVKTILPRMKQQGGVIINMASIVSHIAVKDRLAYTTTKGAVWAMTNSIAKDYLEDGIRCNSVSPARVHTPFVDDYLEKNYPGREKEMYKKLSQTQPIGRMANPQEVADLVLYLCSNEASFITGTDFPIDGGFIKLNGN